VEFVRAEGVNSKTIYVYDGAALGERRNQSGPVTDTNYGIQSNKKIWVIREFTNSAANHLGMPLPKGRARFYRREAGGQMQFIGENDIEHTPRDETVRVRVGDAFDVVGERKRTDIKVNFDNPLGIGRGVNGFPVKEDNSPTIDESFGITLRNHKQAPAMVRVVEHLYRWSNWEIKEKSMDFSKKDAQTIEFEVPMKASEEKSVTYKVHYSW